MSKSLQKSFSIGTIQWPRVPSIHWVRFPLVCNPSATCCFLFLSKLHELATEVQSLTRLTLTLHELHKRAHYHCKRGMTEVIKKLCRTVILHVSLTWQAQKCNNNSRHVPNVRREERDYTKGRTLPCVWRADRNVAEQINSTDKIRTVNHTCPHLSPSANKQPHVDYFWCDSRCEVISGSGRVRSVWSATCVKLTV